MKHAKGITASLSALLCLLALAGCAPEAGKPANELRFELDGISDLAIAYDDEDITFFAGSDDALVVREYMTVNERSYYAKVSRQGGRLHISEGGKPLMKAGFARRVEVYLPAAYRQALSVTTSSGSIVMDEVDLHLASLRTDSSSGATRIAGAAAEEISLSTTSGSMDLGCLRAENIRLEATSGSITCGELDGRVAYTATGGSLTVQSAAGSGSYVAGNSGKLQVAYAEVTGDLALFNKNDGIVLALPAGLAFEFTAVTKNGTVDTSFQQSLAVRGSTASGTVGSNPTVHVQVETKNGDIKVTQ